MFTNYFELVIIAFKIKTKRMRRKKYFLSITFLITALSFSGCSKGKTKIFYDLIEDFDFAELIQETSRINFDDEKVNDLLLKNWSAVEKSGAWATSTASQLKFYTFFPWKDQRLALKCYPFSYPNSPPQHMTLSLNENHISTRELSNKEESYYFLLPAEYLKNGENILNFRFDYAKSPAEVFEKKDDRNLAAKFKTINFLDKKIRTQNIFKKEKSLFFNPLSQLNYYLKLPLEAHLHFSLNLKQVRNSKLAKDLKLCITVTQKEGKEEKVFEIPLYSHLSEKEDHDVDLHRFERNIIRLGFKFDFPETFNESEVASSYAQLMNVRIVGKKESGSKEADFSDLLKKKKEIKRTNLIIALLDAVNYRHMSCYGYHRETTPHIDRIAAEGFLFTKAYSQASWTLPSITSLFTATYPITHKVWSLERKLSDEAITLAEALKERGFKTCAITATASASSVFNLFQGIDEKYELYDEKRENLRSRYRKHVAWAEDFLKPGLEWVENHKDGQFFMYLHYLQPHEPYNPPKRFRGEFSQSYKSSLAERTHLTPSFLEGEKLTQEDREYLKAAYDENLKYADFYLEKFLRGLKDLGVYENTIIVITADHGEAFFEHGSIGHSHSLYDEEIRIPLIIRFPSKFGLGKKKINALVQFVDLMPTFKDIYGLEIKKQNMDGKSLIPLFFDEKKEINEFTLSSLSKPFVEDETRAIALVDQKHKLIITNAGNMFFNLEEDPKEQQDIYQESPVLAGYYLRKLSKAKNVCMARKDLAIKGKYILDRKTREHLKALGYLK